MLVRMESSIFRDFRLRAGWLRLHCTLANALEKVLAGQGVVSQGLRFLSVYRCHEAFEAIIRQEGEFIKERKPPQPPQPSGGCDRPGLSGRMGGVEGL